MNEELKTFGWDDEISNEGTPFVLFPAGDYPFTVTNFERSTYQPAQGYQSKVPTGCLMAVLSLEFVNPATGEKSTIKEKLYLYEKGEWRISEFFVAIGQKKKGEPVRPNWQAVLGATGMAKLEVNKYTKKGETEEKQNNRVKNFLEPSEVPIQQVVPQQPMQQAPAQQVQQNYQTQPQQPMQQQAPVTPFPGATTGNYNMK